MIGRSLLLVFGVCAVTAALIPSADAPGGDAGENGPPAANMPDAQDADAPPAS